MFQWKDYRLIADELLMQEGEAYVRCAISRYYYSIFGSTRQYLIEDMHKYKFAKDNGDVHWQIYDELTRSDDFNEIQLGECLGFLRVARNHADYDNLDDCHSYFEKNLEKVIGITDEAFEFLNVLKNNPPFVI